MFDLTRLRPMPEALAEAIRGDRSAFGATRTPNISMRQRLERMSRNATEFGAAEVSGYGQAALARELDTLRQAPAGQRNHALNRAAFALYQLVDKGVLGVGEVEASLITVGMGIGLGDAEVVRTLDSARKGAAERPRSATRLPTERPVLRTPAPIVAVSEEPDTVAVSEEPDTQEPPRLYPALAGKLLTTPEMLERPGPTPLLGDILFKGTLAALYGHPGSMKSFLALDWCLSLAKDYQWFDKPLHHGASCLYVAAEGVAGIGPRVRAWLAGHSGIHDHTIPTMSWYPEAIDLTDAEWVEALAWHAAATGPSLIVIDTLSRSMPGGDENNSVDMSGLVGRLDRVRVASGATILVVHHSPKVGGGLRGHSSLHGACDTEIEVSRDEKHLLVKCAKQKDAEAFADINLWWRGVEGYRSIVLTNEAQDADEGKIERDAHQVWSKLASHYNHTGATKALLVEACGLTEREVVEAVNWLFDQRPAKVVKEGTGYRAVR